MLKRRKMKNKGKNLINHKMLGGDVVYMPQRKPNRAMNGKELLTKVFTGSHKKKKDDKGWK
jgi:hypothetical protein